MPVSTPSSQRSSSNRSRRPVGPRARCALQPELMDGPLSYAEARRALRDLDRVNRWTLGLGALLRCLLPKVLRDEIRESTASTPADRDGGTPGEGRTRLLDVGAGTGYGLRRLSRAAARRGIRSRLVAVDRRLVHLVVGRELHDGTGTLQHRVVADAHALPFRDAAFHWTTSHLLFHHFGGETNRRIVDEMRRCASRGATIVDLRPSPVAATLIRLIFPVLGIGHVARTDGLLSIRQAWSAEDVRALARTSHWPVTELRRRFPFRWSLVLDP